MKIVFFTGEQIGRGIALRQQIDNFSCQHLFAAGEES